MTVSTAPGRAAPTKTVVSFTIDAPDLAVPTPISTGIPLPLGRIYDATRLRLSRNEDRPFPAQFEPLAHWPDGSLRAVRLDFVMPAATDPPRSFHLSESDDSAEDSMNTPHLAARQDGRHLVFRVEDSAEIVLDFPLTRPHGTTRYPRWRQPRWTARGPVRWTWEHDGNYAGCNDARLIVRVSAWRGTPLLQMDVTLHNPRRARHPGGLWDLGDKNSLLFDSFNVVARRAGTHQVHTRLFPDKPFRGPRDWAKIYQDSSGGLNWNSRNHINRNGVVPCRFRGFEYQDDQTTQETGERAQPTFALGGDNPLAITLPHFWQQFPSSLSASREELRVGLFPADWDDLHELMPGERKTHTLWLSVSDHLDTLNFAHDRPLVVLPPEWYAECELFEAFPTDSRQDSDRSRDYIATAIDPDNGLAARREVIDEYGWRHWGDLWADHEQRQPDQSPPVISHYNNQYDVIEGCLRHFARSGDRAWWELATPLARHCVDIDTYHTDADRPAYNHGLFWHTDHYQSADRASHRTYARSNAAGRAVYGGGPSSSHCYSTGYLHLYYLTGDPVYRQAVLELADWLIAMEDGAKTEYGLFDSGDTGTSTISAEPWYHGPGRGPANTINTLVDAWELTGAAGYRDHAEMIIDRVINAGDGPEAHELLDAERRWSYIVFLLSLAKYLAAKQLAGEYDEAYGRGVATAREYAAWMLENETPFFDRADEMEYPTETWGAQDIRKANAMRRLVRFCDGPLAARLLAKSHAIADRGWSDLLRFDTHTTLRPTAIVLIEGLRDEFFRYSSEREHPDPGPIPTTGARRRPFRPQRERVRAGLRSPVEAARYARRALNPKSWKNFANAIRARL